MKKITLFSILFAIATTINAQQPMDIEHLMDGTYRIQRNVTNVRFTDNGGFSYKDKQGNEYFFDKKGKPIQNSNTKSSEQKIHPDIAFVKNNNIFVINNGQEKQLSFDGDSLNIIIGQSVHRNEFGINEGIYISDNKQYMAYYRMDQSMVLNYPLVNTMERQAKCTPIKYPMAGMTSHEVEVWVYNYQLDKQVKLQTRKDNSVEERQMYLTNISFSPDGKTVYIQKLNRKQNHLWMEAYNSDTGIKKRTLFEQTSDKYVEPEHHITFLPNDESKFIYFSEQDGWQHLYIYDTNGNKVQQLTKGNWIVDELAGFNKKGNICYFYATKDSPLERNLYGVNLKDGKIKRYTPEHGTHYVTINDEGTLFIDQFTSTQIPWAIIVYNDKQQVVKILEKCEDPFDKLSNKPTIKIDSMILSDGTLVYTRMILPKDFNKNKKYPVLIYVYGGPHAQLITDSWTAGAGNFLPFLATKDYIVWTMDSRGSANRGYDFESAIWHQCGTQEIKDQMEGVNYLKSLPFVDSTRIGIDGWSYGGFMTLSMTLRNPGTFKVSTAGGPVIDWKWYEVMYGERYMGTPEDNPQGYKNASVLSYIDNIPDNARILVLQGYQDNTVVPQHSLEFIRQCVEKKKPVDYFMYTSHEHNVRGKDRVELYKKLFRYYEDFLKK